MNNSEDSSVPAWRWAVWLLFAAAWTTILLIPIPNSGPLAFEEMDLGRRFIFTKTIHVTAYAFFAGLTGWLRAPSHLRWLLMFLLMAHGTGTELLQKWLETRSGLLEDVGFDNAGIAIGALLSWRWWTEMGSKFPAVPRDRDEHIRASR